MKMVLVTWLDTNENSVGGWIEKANLDKSEVCSVDSLGCIDSLESLDSVVIIDFMDSVLVPSRDHTRRGARCEREQKYRQGPSPRR